MRAEASVLHLDVDAFFAAVEQRDKPSLRGKPVVVGGLGPRGVVSTASYEARVFGVRSAMRTVEARSRCPHAAYLTGRFEAYRQSSRAVMRALREISPIIEPLSLDEAYVDLSAGDHPDLSIQAVQTLAKQLKERVREYTGGLTGSVGIGTSKLIAKIASDLEKPDGLVIVPPGSERRFLHPMQVTTIPGVGPATAERLRRIGVKTVGDLDQIGESELISLVGQAHGSGLARLARAEDDRPVEHIRESKSVSVEDTFDRDIADRAHLDHLLVRMAGRVAERLAHSSLSGRTVTVKIRLFDFTTHTRSATLPGPTDDARVISRIASRLLEEVDTSAGVRLLGVGVSHLADWVQDDLFSSGADENGENGRTGGIGHDGTTAAPGAGAAATTAAEGTETAPGVPRDRRRFAPGVDVVHARYGPGWVWGSGLGRVTVRFETAETGPGPVRTLAVDDPDLGLYTPLLRSPR